MSGFLFVPPHIFEAIARNGSPEQRSRAQRALRLGETMRAARARAGRPVRATPGSPARRAPGEKSRIVSTASFGRRLPGTRARVEHQAGTGDAAVDGLYDRLGAAFDLFWDVYGRDSIDGNGMQMAATAHFDSECQNALWDGRQVVVSDGADGIFTSFDGAEVIGHEVSHGIVGFTANLDYIGQAGALSESICDVFGSLVKQYAEKPRRFAAQASWLIGAGLLAPGLHGCALRSMRDPGTAYDDALLGADPQPAHMREYVTTASDDCGVHINSGIPSKAFCLVALALGGYAWTKAGNIWYRTLLDPRLTHTAQFRDFANLTAETARALYGKVERRVVVDAWHQVGIVVT